MPLVPGMARVSITANARKRKLFDPELRALWTVCERMDTPYARLLQVILLTGTRLREAANAERAEIDGSAWTIPDCRYKRKPNEPARDFLVPLSGLAQDIIARTPVVGDGRWLFTHDGLVPINSFGDLKRDFDVEMLAELRKHDPEAKLERWCTHDLRRTARSLMSRAGVDKDHAERALGHVIGGVRGVYDRHEFEDEKRQAFEKLADLVERILNPGSNVIQMRRDIAEI
jgi:integrase